MASLEERLSGSVSADSPLHAFSLPGARADAQAPGARGLGWRQTFGDLWNQIALGDLVGRHADPTSVAIKAKRHFEVVQRDLLALWKESGASRRSVLRCAAVPLECSARVWQAFGPVAGDRRLHLLRRLEGTLSTAERQILAAELPILVNRLTISHAVRVARAAIDDLMNASVDPAEALAALEDAAVELAASAIRIAINLDQIGSARRPRSKQPAGLARQLQMLAGEVSSAARTRRSVRGEDRQEEHIGVWLSAALSVDPPIGAIELATERGGDPSLHADALLGLRARWLELAVGLWVIVESLDHLLALETFGDEQRLRSAVSSRAGNALVGSDLSQRPGDFDHRQAWDRQRGALYELVGDVCLALQTCEPDAVVRSQQLALRRLARALVAIWAVDERVRSPRGQASRQCL
jgi:hypothetical protein